MIGALRDAIETLLLTEPTFVADIAALGLGTHGEAVAPAKVLRGFRPIGTVGQERYPVWLLDTGDKVSTAQSVGSHHQEFEDEILLALLWHQQDHDTAVNQRDALLERVVQLFLRNPNPGGIADVWVDAAGNDRGARHPAHTITFRLLAGLSIEREG